MGGVDYLTNKEISLLKGDIEAKEATLQAQQISLANSLKNGVGEDIINTLKRAESPQKENNRKRWFKWIRKKS